MDLKEIKEKVEDLVEKIMDDKTLMAKFQKDPMAVVEKLIGVGADIRLVHIPDEDGQSNVG